MYVSRVKWNNPGKGVAPSPTPRCSSYWKRKLSHRNIVNTIKTSGHSSLEQYTSHTLFEMVRKGYVWEVSWNLYKAATYWPPALLAIAALLSQPVGCSNGGPEVPVSAGTWFSLLEQQQLTLNSDLQLTWSSSSTELYNCLTLTCFTSKSVASALNSTSQLSRLSLHIFDRMHLLFTRVHFLFDSSVGWEVNMLHSLS